ncbi:hypothetical protein B1H19_25545 [Streptomyces gilvosporeus]|uniref:Uncharacterized protein n=1 Tax=Streptomyces gilvosporeus TaxID=553510 RepID=A0A1V0TW11_9ACTN|nr:hypothetical protein B1H19_25545 [Streptomyces gilvosporeus]
MKLKELNAHFPFMQYDELAQSYENGDPVATQWGNLLTDEMFSSARGLLRQIHSDDQLRKLFPFFSHGTLRLARDYSDRTAGEIWITPLRSGGYRIESTDSDINREEVESTDQIIDIALSLLGRP